MQRMEKRSVWLDEMHVLRTWSRSKDFIKLRGYLKIYETMKNTNSFQIKRKPPPTKEDPRSCERARGRILFCFICLLKAALNLAQPCCNLKPQLYLSQNPGSLFLVALLLQQLDFVISKQPSCPSSCSCGVPKLKGGLLILITAAVWLENSLERGHRASIPGALK